MPICMVYVYCVYLHSSNFDCNLVCFSWVTVRCIIHPGSGCRTVLWCTTRWCGWALSQPRRLVTMASYSALTLTYNAFLTLTQFGSMIMHCTYLGDSRHGWLAVHLLGILRCPVVSCGFQEGTWTVMRLRKSGGCKNFHTFTDIDSFHPTWACIRCIQPVKKALRRLEWHDKI